jgi:hypothetical protein
LAIPLYNKVNILQSLPLDETPGRLHELPPGQIPWTRDNLPPRPNVLREPKNGKAKQEYKLCIVGAGMAGLYIALILDTLDIPGISFDFFEASDRIGGRCLTHEFSKIPHDYYDVGAMRYQNHEQVSEEFCIIKRTAPLTGLLYEGHLISSREQAPTKSLTITVRAPLTALCSLTTCSSSSPNILRNSPPIRLKSTAFLICKLSSFSFLGA